MQDLVTKLTSRKFLLALSAVVALLAYGQYHDAVVIVLGYLGVNVADSHLNG